MTDTTDTGDDGTPSDPIQPIPLSDEMESSFLEYAMSVIMSRALPDVRDGLKPVHRRVLYAVDDAHNAGFAVGEEFSVTDNRTSRSVVEQAARQAEAQALATDIRQRATHLLGVENEVASKITAVTAELPPTFTETPINTPRIRGFDRTWKRGPDQPEPRFTGIRWDGGALADRVDVPPASFELRSNNPARLVAARAHEPTRRDAP